jgi:hypothetical protein
MPTNAIRLVEQVKVMQKMTRPELFLMSRKE